jgi:hypothetical protein
VGFGELAAVRGSGEGCRRGGNGQGAAGEGGLGAADDGGADVLAGLGGAAAGEAGRGSKCCREDVLFFFKGFVDLFQPRLGEDDENQRQVVPFIPWPRQVDAIEYADEWMGKRDIRVNKSRAQGASYLYSMMFLHRWLFHPMFKLRGQRRPGGGVLRHARATARRGTTTV